MFIPGWIGVNVGENKLAVFWVRFNSMVCCFEVLAWFDESLWALGKWKQIMRNMNM